MFVLYNVIAIVVVAFAIVVSAIGYVQNSKNKGNDKDKKDK